MTRMTKSSTSTKSHGPANPGTSSSTRSCPHLLIEPFRTFDVHEEVQWDGWQQIMTALDEARPGPVPAARRGLVPGSRACRTAAQAVAAILLRNTRPDWARKRSMTLARPRRPLPHRRVHRPIAGMQGERCLLRPDPGFAAHQGHPPRTRSARLRQADAGQARHEQRPGADRSPFVADRE